MKKGYSIAHEKLDRKIVERNRRIHMKDLCFRLTSLIPPHHLNSSQGMQSRQHQLDEAGTYIKLLEKRVEELKARRAALAMGNHDGTDNDGNTSIRIELPVVELRECLGSSLEVVLITGLNKNFTISQAIGVFEDEGAEVVSASFSTVGDKVFHTLHAQAKVCRVGVDTAKVCQRLKELIC
ncbi:transcription factor bHLH162-like [Rhododendron vialii]|uniref:transcription factor bHLH162-like n=1 Tax=Rhododendron vialii TaxID=182163 RepID=UPI00265EAB5A|nr:transcription factor bHLH162-like [Rhododendron vialii]